eukprot:3939457-Rhodomonas_salina.1
MSGKEVVPPSPSVPRCCPGRTSAGFDPGSATSACGSPCRRPPPRVPVQTPAPFLQWPGRGGWSSPAVCGSATVQTWPLRTSRPPPPPS